jgi:predicted RNA-binding Zn ribbon-like protein
VRSAPAYAFDFSGGALCLDFLNTIGDRAHGRDEHLVDWASLVSWSEQAGQLSRRDASALRKEGESQPRAAERAFRDARAIRECLYRVFAVVAAGRMPDARDMSLFNAALAKAMAHAEIDGRGGRFVWSWAPGHPSFGRLLWPVLRSAADLLVSPERTAVRECASDRCSWLFVDRSRTHRRRWCSMTACGNRAKVRRFYERQRKRESIN